MFSSNDFIRYLPVQKISDWVCKIVIGIYTFGRHPLKFSVTDHYLCNFMSWSFCITFVFLLVLLSISIAESQSQILDFR